MNTTKTQTSRRKENVMQTEDKRIYTLWQDLKEMNASGTQLFQDCLDAAKYKGGHLAEVWLGYVIRFDDLSAVLLTIDECEVLA